MVFKSRSTETSARLYYSANSPCKITYASLARVVFLRVHTIHYVCPQATAVHEMYHGDVLRNGPRREKNCHRGFANNTGADQPAHPRSLISAFVIRFVESIICKLATGKFQFSS